MSNAKYNAKYDVVGIGNAIVDVLSFADDSAVSGAGLVKGSMTLVEEATALKLYGGIGQTIEFEGGGFFHQRHAAFDEACAGYGAVVGER